MKVLVSLILLLLAVLMFVGAAFEIEGIMGMPNLFWAYALALAAQVALLISGHIASPKAGKIGFFRVAAVILYLWGALALPTTLTIVLVEKFRHDEVRIGSSQLTWGLVQFLVSVTLLGYSARTWHLFRNGSRGN